MYHGTVAFTQKHQLEINNEDKDLVVSNCGYFIAQNHLNTISTEDDNHDYLLIYLHKGTMSLQREPHRIIPEGSIVLYEPDELRAYTFHANSSNEQYYIFFKGKSAQNYLKQYNIFEKKYVYIGADPNLIPLFENIIADFKIHSFDDYIFRTAMLLEILNKIYYNYKQINTLESSNDIEKIINYMDNSAKILSLSSYAEMCHMSCSTFMRKFKKYTGQTPLEYATNAIVKQAEFLLKYSSLSIYEIAKTLNFNDQFYFSNFFKKHCGVSPKKYRDTL